MDHIAPIISLFDGAIKIDLSAVIMITLTCLIVFIIAMIATRKLSVDKPGKMQNFIEWAADFVKGIVASAMDMKQGKAFVALGMTLIMFIFVGNMLGLPFAIVTEHTKPLTVFGQDVITQEYLDAEGFDETHGAHILWYKSPTADPSITIGLALLIIFLANFLGLTKNTKAYLKSFIEPFPLFLPLNIIGELSKLLTLGMRLFGNIFAGEVMISTIIMAGAAGIIGLIPWMGFSIFVGAIQAFIFTVLSMVYISQTISPKS